MRTRQGKIEISALALAVQGVMVAMCAMPAHADEALVPGVRLPGSFVEFGLIDTSRNSAKFGEYNGMNKSGGYLIGNFGLRGGDAYSGNGTTRWSVTGTDLGLTSRSLGASISNQGKWNLGINYDELRHYTSDSYQTPYQGSMGGNTFTLPGFAATASTTSTRSLSAAQLARFQTMEISNTRENFTLNGGYTFNSQWDLKVDFNRLDQSGAKLMAFGSAQMVSSGTTPGQKVSILPMPQDYKTDTINAAINWTGTLGHATGSYFGSFFRNSNNGVRFDTFAGTAAPVVETMGTPPSNDFHQLSLTGGYAFSNRTRLAGGLSYSRNTQNMAYAYDSTVGAVGVAPMITASPTSSLNGSVRNTHADLKVTDQTTKNLALSAGFKYDNRDNRTASNVYNATAINGGDEYKYPNTPLSIKKTQFEFAGDYRVDMKQKIRLAYVHDQMDRKCNQYAVIAPTTISSSLNTYPAGTNCVTATRTKEDKLGATYRLKATENLNLNVGYTHSDRKTSFDDNAITAMISVDANPSTLAAASKIRGLGAGDYVGFHPFFEASRKQDLLKAGANWQATDRLSFTVGGRSAIDKYQQSLGATRGTQWSLNLDGTYAYMGDGSVSAYVTQQERTRDVTDQQGTTTATATRLAVPAGGTWTNKLKDQDTTFGLGIKQGGLMGGKLELLGDLTYSIGKTRYETTLNYPPTTALTCADPILLTCGILPNIKSTMTQFKLTGIYQLDKTSKVTLGYLYRHLSADDFYYNGLQNTFTPTGVLPTNQQAPSYSVNMIWASYVYSFQ